jgi:hypothetical protein
MDFFNTLMSSNPSLVSFGSVALAITMLTATLGSLAYKATQAPVQKR